MCMILLVRRMLLLPLPLPRPRLMGTRLQFGTQPCGDAFCSRLPRYPILLTTCAEQQSYRFGVILFLHSPPPSFRSLSRPIARIPEPQATKQNPESSVAQDHLSRHIFTMAALVQGYPQQSGTVTVLQTRPSSAGGILQSVPVQSATQFLPGGSHRNSLHGLPSTVTAPVVYHGGSGPVQHYALRSMPNFNPPVQWQHSRAHRTSSSPAVPNVQAFDYMQPAGSRTRYAASASMTNLPSTANLNLQPGFGTRDDSALPAPGTRRAATAPRAPQVANGTQSQLALGQGQAIGAAH